MALDEDNEKRNLMSRMIAIRTRHLPAGEPLLRMSRNMAKSMTMSKFMCFMTTELSFDTYPINYRANN